MKPVDKLLKDYFSACEAIGKPLNGLQKMKIRLELKNADANRVLEIIDEIDKIKQMVHTHSIRIDANVHAPATSSPHVADGTAWNQYDYSGTVVGTGSVYDPWRTGTWNNSSGGTK